MKGIYHRGTETQRREALSKAIGLSRSHRLTQALPFPSSRLPLCLRASVVKVSSAAFTLIELLITIAIIALLLSILTPTLRGTLAAARTAKCHSNQRQLAVAWSLYGNDFRDFAVPAAYWQTQFIGTGPVLYWFGADSPTAPPGSGTLMPYLSTARAERSALECPEQPSGTYTPQTQNLKVSTTYGYNGYYLSPEMTPGWAAEISFRPWRKLADVRAPSSLLVFADTLLASVNAATLPRSTALLDPPMLYSQYSGWQTNSSPTTAFRHGLKQKSNVAAHADGSATQTIVPTDLLKRDSKGRFLGTGSLTKTPEPGYVPDWEQWPS